MWQVILQSFIGFILALGILVIVHEWGHFTVARWMKVHVLRFSVGMGKVIWRCQDKRGTEYALSSLPLGGYVKLLGETPDTPVPAALADWDYSKKSVWARMAIIVAGSGFNILFAILAYWAINMIGMVGIKPVIGAVQMQSPAWEAGLRSGQTIQAIDGVNCQTWECIVAQLSHHVGDEQGVLVQTDSPEAGQQTHRLRVLARERDWVMGLGIEPFDPLPARIERVLPQQPAAQAGLEVGDEIRAIDGVPVHSRQALVEAIQGKAEQTVKLQIARDGRLLEIPVTPGAKAQGDGTVGFIGIEFVQAIPDEYLIRTRLGPWAAGVEAVKRTGRYIALNLEFLWKMLSGKLSLEHVGGPIMVAKLAGQTVYSGGIYFLNFLALMSIGLGVINLLPIPVLDGGHFVFCLIELIRGRPLSLAWQVRANQMGVMFIICATVLALYNDILHF